MKRYNLITLLVFCILALVQYSCEDMMSVHEEYVNREERSYAQRPDLIIVKPGKLRSQINLYYMGNFKATYCKIIWNENQDSIDFNLSLSSDTSLTVDSVIVENLEEGTHLAKLYTFDSHHNRSVANDIFLKAYGEKYLTTLSNRTIDKVFFNDTETFTMQWLTKENNSLFTYVEVVDNSANSITKIADKDSMNTEFEDFPVSGKVKVKTAYIPDENAIDTFYTNITEYNISDILNISFKSSASFIEVDESTLGNWVDKYGTDGYVLATADNWTADSISISIKGADTWVWKDSSSEAKALQYPNESSRIESCWYKNDQDYSILINTNEKPCQLAIYFLDNEGGRTTKITASDVELNKELGSAEISNYEAGKYMLWEIEGNIKLKVSSVSGNRFISGIFIKKLN